MEQRSLCGTRSIEIFIYTIQGANYRWVTLHPRGHCCICFIASTSTRLLIQVATPFPFTLLSILKREDNPSCYSPFACTLHASYAKQAMHVPVPLPPEKVSRLHHRMDALVLGSWQMHHHINQGKALACNYSKRCTLL